MMFCEHCRLQPTRPRSRFCSERCRGRARRRWARGLPADTPGPARPGELLAAETRVAVRRETAATALRRLAAQLGAETARAQLGYPSPSPDARSLSAGRTRPHTRVPA